MRHASVSTSDQDPGGQLEALSEPTPPLGAGPRNVA